MTFGEKVRYARMRSKLSQGAFANELGVSNSTISRWERENRSPQAITEGCFYEYCEKQGIEFKDAERYKGGV